MIVIVIVIVIVYLYGINLQYHALFDLWHGNNNHSKNKTSTFSTPPPPPVHQRGSILCGGPGARPEGIQTYNLVLVLGPEHDQKVYKLIV